MHYVTEWRKENIMKMPYPNIEAIGFSTGEDFINWMKQGNEFTENMGILVCKDIQLKIQALGVKAFKNKKKIVFEFGMLQAKTLGFLLCICESHRRVEFKIAKEKDFINIESRECVVTDMTKYMFYYDEELQAEVTTILNGQKFLNKRGTKSFGNYILAKSEEGKYGIGYFLVSVMRSHTLDEKLLAAVTQKYLSPNVNGTIDDICLTLFDRGIFGFAKYQLLSMVNSQFTTLGFREQTSLINELAIQNSDIENACQVIHNNKAVVSVLITKAIKNPKDAIKVLNKIAYGPNCAGHQHTKCLLRAVISSDILNDIEIEVLDKEYVCLRENPQSCIGCPMLIQELLFMTEVNKRLLNSLERCLSSQSKVDREMYTQLIYKGYIPLLKEFEQEYGKARLSQFVDMKKVKELNNEIKQQRKRVEYIRKVEGDEKLC